MTVLAPRKRIVLVHPEVAYSHCISAFGGKGGLRIYLGIGNLILRFRLYIPIPQLYAPKPKVSITAIGDFYRSNSGMSRLFARKTLQGIKQEINF